MFLRARALRAFRKIASWRFLLEAVLEREAKKDGVNEKAVRSKKNAHVKHCRHMEYLSCESASIYVATLLGGPG